MMMLGEKVPAAQALDWGMIYKVVDDDALMTEAGAGGAGGGRGPPVHTKKLLNERRPLSDLAVGTACRCCIFCRHAGAYLLAAACA
jgi:enoyl-CoA hydratase/carnithine racemase